MAEPAPTTVKTDTVGLETHGLGAHLTFAEDGLSPYWGVTSVYEPDHADRLNEFDALDETWVVDESKHWEGQLAPPEQADNIDGGMNEYQYQLVADDRIGDRDLTLQFRPGYPDAENVHSGDPIQGIPDEHPASIRVQVMATNLDVDEVLPLLRSFADHIGLNPEYFETPHEYSSVYQLERYARLLRMIAEARLTGDGGLIDQLADFASSQDGRGMYKWDHEDVQAHYEAVGLDPDTWELLIPGQSLGKQLKCYHPNHVRDADADDPLSEPKVEISLSSEYDPDGTVPWSDVQKAIADLDEAVYHILHWANVPLDHDDDAWIDEDPYFESAAAGEVELKPNPLPDLREATTTLVKDEMVYHNITETDQELLLALTDGGTQDYQRLAERADASTSSVYRLLDKFASLLDSDNGIVQFADELTREHVSEIVEPLRDAAEWGRDAIRQAADRESLVRRGDGQSALEQWMRRHGIDLVDAGTRLHLKVGRPIAKRKLVKVLRAGLEAAEASGYESDFRDALIDWQTPEGDLLTDRRAFIGDRPLGKKPYRF